MVAVVWLPKGTATDAMLYCRDSTLFSVVTFMEMTVTLFTKSTVLLPVMAPHRSFNNEYVLRTLSVFGLRAYT